MKIAWKILIMAIFTILIIAGAAAIYGLYPMGSGSNEAGSNDLAIKGSVNVTTEPDKVELLYFHRTDRCVSCNNAEQYTRDTLDKYYAEEMRSGQLSLQSIDYQQDRETADKYNVKVQGLKVVSTHGGQTNIKDIPEIWTYVGDRDAFIGFLKSVIDKELRK